MYRRYRQQRWNRRVRRVDTTVAEDDYADAGTYRCFGVAVQLVQRRVQGTVRRFDVEQGRKRLGAQAGQVKVAYLRHFAVGQECFLELEQARVLRRLGKQVAF